MSIVMVKQEQGDSHIKRSKKSYAVGKVLCSFMEKKVTKVGRNQVENKIRVTLIRVRWRDCDFQYEFQDFSFTSTGQ